jgi:hypothetical protein
MTKRVGAIGWIMFMGGIAGAQVQSSTEPSVGRGGAAVVVSNNTNQALHFDLSLPGGPPSEAAIGPSMSQEYPCPTGCDVIIATDNGHESRVHASSGERVALRWNGTYFEAVKQ